MYIELHDEKADGAVFYRKVYDLGEIPELIPYSINAPSALSTKDMGYYDNTNPSVVQNYAETYDLPLTDEEEGNILTDSIFPVQGAGQYEYKCYNENPSAFEQMTIGTKPDDFDTNPHYCWFTNWRAPDNNIYYCQVPSAKMEWDASKQYWYDKEHKISKRIFAGMVSFYISKLIDCNVGYYNNTRAWIQWGANVIQTTGGGYQNTATFTEIPAENVCLSYNGTAIQYGNYNNYIFDKTSMPSATGDLVNNGNLCCSCFFVKCSRNNVDYVGIGILQKTYAAFGGAFTRLSLRVINEDIYGDIVHEGDPPEPTPPTEEDWVHGGLPSEIGGGDGTFDYPSDNTGDKDGTTETARATLWNNSFANVGYNKYKIPAGTPQPLEEMLNQLWDPGIFQSFQNQFRNPISAIIACHIMPQNLVDAYNGTPEEIHAAYATLSEGYPATTFKDFYRTYHVGSYDFGKATASFADYDNTAVYIHLPYIGVKQIDIAAVQHGSISVDYTADSLTGDVTAFITCFDRYNNSRQRYSFKGNCARKLPVVQIDSPLTKMVTGLATGVVAGALTGGVGALAGSLGAYFSSGGSLFSGGGLGAIGETLKLDAPSIGKATLGGAGTGLVTSAGKASISAQSVTSSNAEGGSVSTPIDTSCFLIVPRPMWSNPLKYSKQFGYPSDVSGTINASDITSGSKFIGFLSVRSIKLDGIAATDDEIAEIDQLMKAGVYVGEPEQE